MRNILNKILFYGKTILNISVFSMVLYIMFMMQDYYNGSFMEIILIFIPLLLITIVFVISFFFDKGNKSVFVNIASFIALLSILIVCIRTIFDKNMIIGVRDNINYYFFQNQLNQIKIICYMVFISNGLLIYKDKKEK